MAESLLETIPLTQTQEELSRQACGYLQEGVRRYVVTVATDNPDILANYCMVDSGTRSHWKKGNRRPNLDQLLYGAMMCGENLVSMTVNASAIIYLIRSFAVEVFEVSDSTAERFDMMQFEAIRYITASGSNFTPLMATAEYAAQRNKGRFISDLKNHLFALTGEEWTFGFQETMIFYLAMRVPFAVAEVCTPFHIQYNCAK